MRIPRVLFAIGCLISVAFSGFSQYITVPNGNYIFFQDNGQIKCLDDAHRIIFRRAENILEFREFGSIMFSPGAETGNQTAKMFMGSNGNMGIGTTSPRGKLDIWGGTMHVTGSDANGTLVGGAQNGIAYVGCNQLTNGISINQQGAVGIGTSSPSSPFTVSTTTQVISLFKNNGSGNTNIAISNNSGTLSLGVGATTPHPYVWSTTGNFFIGDDGNPTMFVSGMANGNVGIGTQDTKGYKLAVAGNAIFTKVTVKPLPWADYVFNANYRLRPLSEVEQYIKQHHHLPEVPSAEEVEKNGIDVGDNQATLLKKIEELTLYVIEQNKKQAEWEHQVKLLKEEIDQLKQDKKGRRK